MTDEERKSVDIGAAIFFFVGILAGSIALGCLVGAWAGFALFAICNLALSILLFVVLAEDKKWSGGDDD